MERVDKGGRVDYGGEERLGWGGENVERII